MTGDSQKQSPNGQPARVATLHPVTRADRPSDANTEGSLTAIGPLILQNGLQLPPQLGYERWLDMGQRLQALNISTAWCLGDWLIYGEAVFEGRYRKAIEETLLDYQTLRNYAWVARRFPLSRRRDSLSFGHHAEVAALPDLERAYWLRKAEELGWSRNQLRSHVRQSLRMRDPATELPAAREESGCADPDSVNDEAVGTGQVALQPGEVVLKVSLNHVLLNACEAAASMAGAELESWVRRTLEFAARDLMPRQLYPGKAWAHIEETWLQGRTRPWVHGHREQTLTSQSGQLPASFYAKSQASLTTRINPSQPPLQPDTAQPMSTAVDGPVALALYKNSQSDRDPSLGRPAN
jgi:hypothetical protein